MSLEISGGKQVIKFANKSNGGRVSIKSMQGRVVQSWVKIIQGSSAKFEFRHKIIKRQI